MNASTEPLHPIVTSLESKKLIQGGNKQIFSITELHSGAHGNFHVPFENAVVIEICKNCTSIFVSQDGVVYTTDVRSTEFNKAKSIVKNTSGKFDYRLVSQEVLTFIRSQQIQETVLEEKKEDSTESSEAQKLWKSLCKAALEIKASDIHLRVKATGYCAVFFRIDGQLRRASGFNSLNAGQVIRMMNAAVNFDAHKEGGDAAKQFTLATPNDSKVPVNFESGENLQIRVGVMPGSVTDTGKVSLRLLAVGTSTGKPKSFEQLGFLNEQCALIRDAMNSPYGAILFTGPTGSGKSTGIVAALSEVDHRKHIITLENPIENIIDNDACIQCAVNEEIPDLTFSKLLRSALRNDPDVVMVGEVRDSDVASTCARAASTGHLVLTTLHVNNALEVPAALEYYGLALHTITERSFLRLIVAQRLVPKLCDNCKIPLVGADKNPNVNIESHVYKRLTEYFKESISSIFVANTGGCKNCDHCGVKGRALIAEVVKTDKLARDCILSRDSERWRKRLVENGWRDMKSHAEIRVIAGEICPVGVEGELLTPFGTDNLDDTFNYNKFRSDIAYKEMEMEQ